LSPRFLSHPARHQPASSEGSNKTAANAFDVGKAYGQIAALGGMINNMG
jgi:hypothetical protein